MEINNQTFTFKVTNTVNSIEELVEGKNIDEIQGMITESKVN
jgi:hypothetical protein